MSQGFYAFLLEAPVLTVFIALIIGHTVVRVAQSLERTVVGIYHNRVIEKHGWPPEYIKLQDEDGNEIIMKQGGEDNA